MMAEMQASPEARRAAAGELDGADVPGAPLMAKAIRARHTLPPDDSAQNAMAALATLATYLGEPAGAAWLAQAARLRLLVEALHTEQRDRREIVGSGYRDCIRDGACAGCGAPVGSVHDGTCDWERCSVCHHQVMACGCEVGEICALIGQFMQEVGGG